MGFPRDSKLLPTAEQLREFERDPFTVLLALAMNSGQGRFLAKDDTLNEQSVLELNLEIKKNLNKEHIGKVFEKFQHCFNKDAKLLACGTCGIRGFEMRDNHFYAYSLSQLKF